MVSTGLSKSLSQPVAGITILAMMALTCPTPTAAQVPPGSNPGFNQVPADQVPTTAPPTATPVPTAPVPSAVPGQTVPGQQVPPTQVPSTPARGTVPGQAAAPIQAPVDYILGGGDRIRINVFEVPEYSGDYQIPPGGDLYLPLVGGIQILGLTQSEAAEAIATRYARFLKRPLVTVSLVSPRPINIVVAGEVRRPGSYTLALQGGGGDSPGVQYPTVIAAIVEAQGVSLAANLRQVQLRRREGAGGQRIINLDLTQLVDQGNLPLDDITLRDGDRIFVPTAEQVNLADIRRFSTASFAIAQDAPRTVTVVGEVNRPGSYVVIGGSSAAAAPSSTVGAQTIQAGGQAGGGLPTVTRAIQLAGGITSSADIRGIQIRRQTKNGAEQQVSLNLWQMLQGDANQDTLVQEGDTIIIPTATNVNPAEATALADASFSPATIQVSVVGEVKQPGLVNLPPNTPMNQGILTAGGFNDSRARRRDVDLIRLNPDGTVSKSKLPIDLSQGINTKNNPILRDNDIVVVGRSGAARVGDTIGTVFGPIISPFLGILNLFR